MTVDPLINEVIDEYISQLDSFDLEGFFFADLVNIRKKESTWYVPIKRLLRDFLEYKCENPELIIPDVCLADIRQIVKESSRIILARKSGKMYVYPNTMYKIEEQVESCTPPRGEES